VKIKVSIKGHVLLPGLLRRKLGIRAGDLLEVKIEGGRIVLTPQRSQPCKAKIVKDSVTGLPVLSVGYDAPILSSQGVREILTNFP
jgi:AbrB family looped-hinge helix DNA binding protein